MAEEFILDTSIHHQEQFSTKWQAPSNIALIKYWGKHGEQLPANPSLSFTLKECRTETSVTATKGDHGFNVTYEGVPKPEFEPKIRAYFQRIKRYSPWITQYYFKIDTYNTFPHSSGIASSASSMAALSSCIMEMENLLTGGKNNQHKASFLSRLGSGSACRSLSGKAVMWGKHDSFSESSDLYGVDQSHLLDEIFLDFQDTILLVDKGQKTVSSSVGHELMNEHPYALRRFEQAHHNINVITRALQDGDLATFIKVTESEALTLHSMMMTSQPYFILMKPNTLSIIEEIWKFRKEHNLGICFTLDAGANVHMLYPKKDQAAAEELIKSKLAQYCQNGQYICDQVGNGASTLK